MSESTRKMPGNNDSVTRLAEKIIRYINGSPVGSASATATPMFQSGIELLLREAMERPRWWESRYEDGRKSGLAEAAEVARKIGDKNHHSKCPCREIAAAIEKLRGDKG